MPLTVAALGPNVRFRGAAAISATSAMLGAFLLAAPYSLLDLPAFLSSFASLAQHYNAPRPPLEIADQYVSHIRNGFSFGGGGWRNMVGWPAIWLAVAGLAWLAAQVRSRLQLTNAAVVLVFGVAYFWLIIHQSLVFARYALPLVPVLCLGIGMALDRLRAWVGWRPACLVALGLIAIPPTAQAVSFDIEHGKVGTEEIVARWLEHNVPPGALIYIETPRIRLRPEFHNEYTPRLILKSLQKYQDEGAKYLVASSEKFNAATAAKDMAGGDVASYQRLFSSAELVQIVQRTPDHPGPTFTILKVPTK
jgi:hypothetical protein